AVGVATRAGAVVEAGGGIVGRRRVVATRTEAPLLDVAPLGGLHPGDPHLAVASVEDRLRRQLGECRLGRALVLVLPLDQFALDIALGTARLGPLSTRLLGAEDHR